MKIINKKILSVFIFASLVTTILPSMMARTTDDGANRNSISMIFDEYIVDQEQLLHSKEFRIHSNVWVAQSFRPSMTPLTKILIRINKPVVIEYPLELSIRKNLNETELTYTLVQSNDIPYYTHWVEFDFPDIEVEPEEKYYMVIRTHSPAGQSYCWLYESSSTNDPYERGKQWYSQTFGNLWMESDDSSYVDSTFRTYSYISTPDLACDGALNWTEVKPGEIVTGSFTVENAGSSFSYLNWKIPQWPSWGVWSFTPSSGTGLKPEDGPTIVQISVEAPHTEIPDQYSGQITIVNEEDDSDYCTISALLQTPKNKESISSQLLQSLFIHRYSFLERILASRSYNGKILNLR
jgi:hypothetical protein